MAWTTPTTVNPGDAILASLWNTQVRDNLAQLGTGYTYVTSVYFTSSGTFSKASYPYLRAVRVYVTGGGGGGGGCPAGAAGQVSIASGGGGGATALKFFDATAVAAFAASITVTVGAGGTAGGAGANDGGAGGQSAFGTTTANGGTVGGAGASVAPVTGAGFSGFGNETTANADLSISGGDATRGVRLSANTIGNGGGIGSTGGDSFWARGGYPHSAAVGGSEGRLGSGGGGGYAGTGEAAIAGKAGGSGIVIVELYA